MNLDSTSLSILLPAFIAVVALWWWAHRTGLSTLPWAALAMALALLLWVCTGMIYACIRFIERVLAWVSGQKMTLMMTVMAMMAQP